jgi:mRNA-degrading endonuclease RelE of RelBE toxin-antitoxin system
MSLYRLKFHPDFVNELDAAINYYSEKSATIVKRFKQATKQQLTLLRKSPFTYSERYDDIRFARIAKFPYAIHYSIDPENKEVLVHAFLCDYQNPDAHWGKKL